MSGCSIFIQLDCPWKMSPDEGEKRTISDGFTNESIKTGDIMNTDYTWGVIDNETQMKTRRYSSLHEVFISTSRFFLFSLSLQFLFLSWNLPVITHCTSASIRVSNVRLTSTLCTQVYERTKNTFNHGKELNEKLIIKNYK